MKTRLYLFILLFLCANCNGGTPSSERIKSVSNPNDTGHSLKVYINPYTGEFITPEQAEALSLEKSVKSTADAASHEELTESQSPVPDGGTMIDLKGRFQSPLNCTIESNGEIKIEHKDPQSEK